MSVTLNPTIEQKIKRHQNRMALLKTAIAKEQSKELPDMSRLTSLEAELARRENELQELSGGTD